MNLLARTGMSDCKPATTPIDPSVILLKADEKAENPSEALQVTYRSVVGSLLHLVTGTRPDIAFAVSSLARFQENPTNQHWIAAKHLLRYLKGTPNLGITLGGDSLIFSGSSDSDWGGEFNTRIIDLSRYLNMASPVDDKRKSMN